MKINDSYIEFLQLVNRNATNNNANVDKARFILLYNRTQDKFVEWVLEKRSDDTIRYISDLLVPDLELTDRTPRTTHDDFRLPADFFDHSNLSVYVNSECGLTKIKTWEAKGENHEELYHDVNNEPTAEWEETYYTFASGNVAVYKKGFDIAKAFLSYYRSPRRVDIEGYTNLEGVQSQNIDPELPDKAVRRILTAMAKEFSANNGDTADYQINKDRLFSII